MPERILIVDDEDDIRGLIKGILEDEGYLVHTAGTSASALEHIRGGGCDLVIQDIWLQGSEKDGIDILAEGKAHSPDLPFLMISGHGTIETAVSAIKRGAYDFIEKPFKSDRLLLMIRRALETAALKQQNNNLRQRTADHVGQLIKQVPETVLSMLNRAAEANSRLMITGEVGTGKTVAAQYVHEKSLRAHKPFMIVSCYTTDPEKLERELFGTAGADGAESLTPGIIQLVDGGTLVLDEVHALAPDLQGKILSFLQNGTYHKAGSHQPFYADVRVISTSSKDITSRTQDGSFREDLYYRLNVVPVYIPPLRQRKGDIPVLVKIFSSHSFTPQAQAKLTSYIWPGNTKQFHNVMEWLHIMHGTEGKTLDVIDLPQDMTTAGYGQAQDGVDSLSESVLDMRLREARECFERQYLLSQLDKFEGNISKTASFIGMERSALHRKLKSLDVFSDEKQNVA